MALAVDVRQLQVQGLAAAQGEARLLARQLERKCGPLSNVYRLRIDEASSEQLLAWADRILTAERIEDVLESS